MIKELPEVGSYIRKVNEMSVYLYQILDYVDVTSTGKPIAEVMYYLKYDANENYFNSFDDGNWEIGLKSKKIIQIPSKNDSIANPKYFDSDEKMCISVTNNFGKYYKLELRSCKNDYDKIFKTHNIIGKLIGTGFMCPSSINRLIFEFDIIHPTKKDKFWIDQIDIDDMEEFEGDELLVYLI